MNVTIFSLFPHWFDGPLGDSIVQRARDRGLLSVNIVNPRDAATDKHGTVDDAPYGGGAGMVMRADVVADSMDQAIGKPGRNGRPKTYFLSPRGRPFDQKMAEEMAALPGFALLCGHYETVDERLIDSRIDEEISLGDFILTGGEIAAMAIVDAVTRLIPEALGNKDSAHDDSFSSGMYGLLEGPHYTRPETFEGVSVPEILLSGNHNAIREWRETQALNVTMDRRPDLLRNLLIHPSDIRRIARRLRPFAIWDNGNQEVILSVPHQADAPKDVEHLNALKSRKPGLVSGIWWSEYRSRFHEDKELEQAMVLDELRHSYSNGIYSGTSAGNFLHYLLKSVNETLR